MRILVTGAHGFVGQHVVPALESVGHEVLAPTREMMPLSSSDNNVFSTLVAYDVEAVVHLAAFCGGIGLNRKTPGDMIMQNLRMGIEAIRACQLHGVRLINLGSVCMYPKHTPVPFKEKEIWNGYPEETNAPYGVAKRAIIEASIAYNRQFGFECVNLVPVNMAGEYDHFDLENSHVIPAMIRKFIEARDRGYDVKLWGDGSPTREFLYAGDLAQAIVKAVEWKNPDPEPINIGTGVETSMMALANMIASKVGFEGTIQWDTTMPNGQPRRCLDTSRAEDRLGFKAETTLDETLDRTIQWYETEGKHDVDE